MGGTDANGNTNCSNMTDCYDCTDSSNCAATARIVGNCSGLTNESNQHNVHKGASDSEGELK
ncbi:hypothetical protein VP1G_10809 [Cytospora mali]|uniref:Uncharacterized protein n=1 Tax=Cytospora mali TaxID=578113 RepID=A0A194UX98_CYTMA|nr:hypothetical protein VP1G_10809 [Valsa mali var. pyri (nom. inval.)]